MNETTKTVLAVCLTVLLVIGTVGWRRCSRYFGRGTGSSNRRSDKVSMSNCKASAKNYAVIAFGGADVRITKGTYKACICIDEKAKATINDGYFKDVEIPLLVEGNVTIKAGKFYGANNAVYVDGGKLSTISVKNK